ncbi:hypothetical protein ABZX88_33660 [Kitasatospora aureofaciens]|uniref:hypothetical protein n=1 Tax=Kitasatospora aureofaciens TaxID=1894 RepID=UPI0033B8EAC2
MPVAALEGVAAAAALAGLAVNVVMAAGGAVAGLLVDRYEDPVALVVPGHDFHDFTGAAAPADAVRVVRLVRAWGAVVGVVDLAQDVGGPAQQLLGLVHLEGEAGVAGGAQVGGQVADQVAEQVGRGLLLEGLEDVGGVRPVTGGEPVVQVPDALAQRRAGQLAPPVRGLVRDRAGGGLAPKVQRDPGCGQRGAGRGGQECDALHASPVQAPVGSSLISADEPVPTARPFSTTGRWTWRCVTATAAPTPRSNSATLRARTTLLFRTTDSDSSQQGCSAARAFQTLGA